MLSNLFDKFNDIKARRAEGEGGFTLIELLVVVVIIGILIAIAIPLYLNYQDDAREKSVKADMRNAVTAIQQCYSDNNNSLPDSQTFTGTAAFTGTQCPSVKVTVSTDSTKSLVYTKSNATNYTIKGTDTDDNSWTYTSSDGNTV